MKYDIQVNSDSEFKLVEPTTKIVFVKPTEEDTPQQSVDSAKPAPLDNPRGGHPFDIFAGTSWAGKRNQF